MLSFQTLLQVSVICAFLIIVLLAIFMAMGKHLAAKYRRWIWLILAIQLLLPVSFTLPQAPVQITVPEMDTPVFSTPLPQQSVSAPSALPMSPVPVNGLSVLQVIFAVWLTGVVLAGIYEIGGYQFARKKLYRWSRPVEAPTQIAFDEMCVKVGKWYKT